jgi:L-alanine-DL-glutamate epimerase-like enolase superfamily enzyme
MVKAIIYKEAADVINIKLGYYGLYKAKKIAALTEAAGITWKLGTHYEAGALMIAGLHFAASIENLEARPSEFPMGRWKNPLIRGLEQVDKYGTTFRVPKGPGLGVEVVEADLTLSSG